MNKPKLNEPYVEKTTTTLTTFNSTTRESITINQTIPSRQFKDVFVTGTTVEECIYTEEEIKKEWEKLGYEWEKRGHIIIIYNRKTDKMISINTMIRGYICDNSDGVGLWITFQEHLLLTKTFKMLGWEDSND